MTSHDVCLAWISHQSYSGIHTIRRTCMLHALAFGWHGHSAMVPLLHWALMSWGGV